eukprot:scaffold15153_cov40-Attheya_sp.AAC.2
MTSLFLGVKYARLSVKKTPEEDNCRNTVQVGSCVACCAAIMSAEHRVHFVVACALPLETQLRNLVELALKPGVPWGDGQTISASPNSPVCSDSHRYSRVLHQYRQDFRFDVQKSPICRRWDESHSRVVHAQQKSYFGAAT